MKRFYIFTLLIISQLAHSQQVISSNLPIIIINTKNGVGVPDEPKVQAEMKIINNGKDKTNNINDKPTDYNGLIGIELRGSSSQLWPKKPYGFELQDAKGDAVEASLFGFPKESDFTLFASYNERSLMHSMLAFKIAREMSFAYSSRAQYVELVLNGQYQGVYVLFEKVKRAEGRVNIAKLAEKDIKGDDLTGGYIIKIDKETGSKLGGWRSKILNINSKPNSFSYYQYEYPKTLIAEQRAYIKSYIDSVEAAIVSPNFTDPNKGYRAFINTSSFVKMLILNEVSKNIDGYRISSFFYKDKKSKGGKLVCGPPWDYDFTFGMPDYCDAWTPQNFIFRNFNTVCSGDNWNVPFFWSRLMQDPIFEREVKTEYTFQRTKGILQTNQLKSYVDSLNFVLRESSARNFQKWNTLGRYEWPTKTTPSTWQGEVNEIMPWIEARLGWIDREWLDVSLLGGILANEEEIEGMTMEVFPNPYIDKLKVKFISTKAQKAKITLTDEVGRMLYSVEKQAQIGNNLFEIKINPDLNQTPIKILSVEIDGKQMSKRVVSVQE
jgi:hypothetical protein